MPLTYRVDTTQKIVRSHGSGSLSTDELLAYFAQSRADPAFEPSMHRLMDLREVTKLPSSDEIRALASFARNKAPVVETARMAIIAPSDLAYGVSMMFKAFVGYGERLIVARDEGEAMRWLTNAHRND